MAHDIFSGAKVQRDWSCGAAWEGDRSVAGVERWAPVQVKAFIRTVDGEIEANGRMCIKRAHEKSLPAADCAAFGKFFRAWRFFRDGLGIEPRASKELAAQLSRWRSENADWTKRLSMPVRALVKGEMGAMVPSETAPPSLKAPLLAGLGMAAAGVVLGFIGGRVTCHGMRAR